LLLAGCSKVDRVRECNRLARGTNPRLSRVVAEEAPRKRSAAAFETVAAQYELVADEVGRRRFVEPNLAEATRDYRDLMERAGRASRQIARALPVNDTKAIETARDDLDKIVRREAVTVARINASCAAP
jgi:hypothetical protein